MDCDFTEEVSLLVDGELAPQEAARLGAHVEGCAACRQARESFLLLRQELRSYEWTPDPNAQRAALASILNASTPPRARVSGWLGSLAAGFGVQRLRPAHVAALALLLTGAALGLLWLRGSNGSRDSRRPEVNAVAQTNGPPVQAAEDGGKGQETSVAVETPAVNPPKKTAPPRRAGARPNLQREGESARVGRENTRPESQKPEGLTSVLPQETARLGGPTLLLSPASAVTAYAAAVDYPSLRVGRHAERVERLLRSFRNARLTGGDSALDVADARRLSKRLLYSNIALRREAASAGDLPVEGLLDSVEPILIDISNLPNAPSPAAVGSIKERIDRRQLVGALQAQGMSVSR
ncbi:MAG TPA: zf-HC2 domain-containing protein [Pyrinomonadaceae bacterium]|nr:zf-HC2 domain-containing protein [Pyrinomonadaceae bacterium]